MDPLFAVLYLAGLACFALALRNVPRSETLRRGYLYAAAGSALFMAVFAYGLIDRV